MEYKFIDTRIEPLKVGRPNKWDNLFCEFISSKKPTCIIVFASLEERRKALASLKHYISKHNLNYICGNYEACKIYITSGEKKSKTKVMTSEGEMYL